MFKELMKNTKAQAQGIINTVVVIILILAVLLNVVNTQVSTANRTALGTAGSNVLDILPLGVVVLALYVIFAPLMGGRGR